ncbi:hypothetical protein CEF21_04100 [Bacillus sp. FJAT-42376]|uniref:hypothetical protein n=1 Tax=Bacillus sp. FJAT-42376 TaxID=2014076 RepID=UPI000F4FF103|nr:hypothetical protein [Bacillus sp. FJAT-42376]AZB41543.1 hypothetical protein CEF21_04100 [Bacillus sp. FJAT-42376]
MVILSLILLILLINFYVLIKTKKRIIYYTSFVILPLIPSLTSVWLEIQKEDVSFWLQFLETGSFILSLISLPFIIWFLLLFGLIYLTAFILLVIEFWTVRRFYQKKAV